MVTPTWAGCNLYITFLVAIALILSTLGCVARDIQAPAELQLAEDFRLPSRVAVLPFANSTAEPTAPDVVRKVFYNFLSSLNYQDVELSTVDQVLTEQRLYSLASSERPMSLATACQYLGVDALVSGRVTRFKKIYAGLYTNTQVGAEIIMRHCETGGVIWQMNHTANQRDGEVPLDLPGLAVALVSSYVRYARVSMLQVTVKLCSTLIATIPNPPAVGESPPQITIMVHNGVNRLMQPGDALRVALVGESGHRGSWDLSDSVRNLPLQERGRGIYVGEYVIRDHDKPLQTRLVGRLTARSGAASRWTDVLGPVTLGKPTPLPAVIESDLTITSEHSPYLARDLVVVKPGAMLTIRPGVTIWFSKLGLMVQGTLHMVGEPGRRVRFLGMGEVPWKGVFLDGAQGTSHVLFSEVSGGVYGVHARDSELIVGHTLFEDNQWGVVIQQGRLAMVHSVVRGSAKTGVSGRQAHVAIGASLVTENRGGGAQFQQSLVELEGNGIYSNAEWDLRNHDPNAVLRIPGNWWGTPDPAAVHVQGLVEFTPLLEAPPLLPALVQ